jgi:Cu-processing system permease protein
MTAIWVLAGLTVRESLRRRLLVAGLLIALMIVGIAFIHLPHPRHGMFMADEHTQLLMRSRIIAWVGCGMIKFFSSVLAVTLAAGAISAEVEKGVLSTVVPKPLRRWDIYLGKWLGFLILLAGCLVVWGGLLAWAIWIQTHIFNPRLFLGVLTVGIFPLLFITLTLFFSSFATYALSAGLALIAAGVALAEDTLSTLATVFDSNALKVTSEVVSYIVPLGRMNHWITHGLGDAGLDLTAFGRRGGGDAAVDLSAWDMTYVICYILCFLAAGLVVFQKRDL